MMNEIDRIKYLSGIITEDEVTKVAVGHVDDESDMMRKELYKIMLTMNPT